MCKQQMDSRNLIYLALDFYVLLSFLSIYISKTRESLTTRVYAFCIIIPYLPVLIVPFFKSQKSTVSPVIIMVHACTLGMAVFLWRIYLPLT